MLRIAIVEDQQPNIDQFCEFITRYQAENALECEVSIFRDGSEIIKDYQPGFDIILLDVEMPAINGLDTARMIREKDRKVVLMFVTNMAQYAIHGYEVEALDFVLKPVNYFTFSVRLARAVARANERMGGKVVLQTSEGTVLLNTTEILYLETQNRMLYYHVQGKTYAVRGSLQSAEKTLADYHFVRCNQCYLVNLEYVRGVIGDTVQVAEDTLEISRRCRTAFLGAVAAYVGGNT